MNIVALLESMWGWRGYNDAGEEAPRYFRINAENHSGKRLYRLCDPHNLLVTNCCRRVQRTANDHGKPDLAWVKENLSYLKQEGMELLLICGRIAQETVSELYGSPTIRLRSGTNGNIHIPGIPRSIQFICIDHPAARRWSNAKLDSTRELIQNYAVTTTTKG